MDHPVHSDVCNCIHFINSKFFLYFKASSNDWTVHGVWPTRPGEKGPLFCDKTKKFDFSTLKPILDKLEVNSK